MAKVNLKTTELRINVSNELGNIEFNIDDDSYVTVIDQNGMGSLIEYNADVITTSDEEFESFLDLIKTARDEYKKFKESKNEI